jgi:uncharacterized protein (TIGR04222 family)
MIANPLDLPGAQFLVLYSVLLPIAFAAAVLVRSRRSEEEAHRPLDPDHLAVLAGGPCRLTDRTVAGLLASGSLRIAANGQLHATEQAAAMSEPERIVLDVARPAPIAAIEAKLRPLSRRIAEGLIQTGMLKAPGDIRHQRWMQTAPLLVVLTLGLAKLAVGVERGRPVGILVALLVLTACAALLRWITVERRTAAGSAALAAHRTRLARLRQAPVADELGVAVALFGTAVLAGSSWAAYHRLRRSDGSDGAGIGVEAGSDCGSAGSDGGSGCGGCGGCGS